VKLTSGFNELNVTITPISKSQKLGVGDIALNNEVKLLNW
jgi:hypothetical protein